MKTTSMRVMTTIVFGLALINPLLFSKDLPTIDIFRGTIDKKIEVSIWSLIP